jgi:hypothetical protein
MVTQLIGQRLQLPLQKNKNKIGNINFILSTKPNNYLMLKHLDLERELDILSRIFNDKKEMAITG